MKKLLLAFFGLLHISLASAQEAYFKTLNDINQILNTGYGFEFILIFLITFAVTFVVIRGYFSSQSLNFVSVVISASTALLAVGFMNQIIFEGYTGLYKWFGVVLVYSFVSFIFVYMVHQFDLPAIFRRTLIFIYGFLIYYFVNSGLGILALESTIFSYAILAVLFLVIIFDRWIVAHIRDNS